MAPTDDLNPGDRLGKWVIREPIGAGGMGRVYSARNSVLDRNVALKTIDPAIVAKASGMPEQEILERFRREAQAVAKVKHPNVLELYSYEEINGRPIIEMELLHGETLSRLLRKGPLGVERAAEIVLPICAGVKACHDEGIVHRDLKPQNIYIERRHKVKQEVVKVLDFGVAKFAISADLTQEGRLLGTPTFMSPEQTRGKAADARSDQYAIGVLLYHCLTGRPPYEHPKGTDVLAVLAAVQEGEFPSPRELRSGIPQDLEAITVRAMCVNAEERFASVDALARALVPFAPARVRERWREYFSEAAMSTGPQRLMSTRVDSTTSISTAKDVPHRVAERGSAQADRTLSEGEITTATDLRFTATTAVATPNGSRPADAERPPAPPPETDQPTPWAVPDASHRSGTPLVGRRKALTGAGGVLLVTGLGLWALSARIPNRAAGGMPSGSAGRPGAAQANAALPRAATPSVPAPDGEAAAVIAPPAEQARDDRRATAVNKVEASSEHPRRPSRIDRRSPGVWKRGPDKPSALAPPPDRFRMFRTTPDGTPLIK